MTGRWYDSGLSDRCFNLLRGDSLLRLYANENIRCFLIWKTDGVQKSREAPENVYVSNILIGHKRMCKAETHM